MDGLSLEEIKHYTELYLRGEETLQQRKEILTDPPHQNLGEAQLQARYHRGAGEQVR
ncbi:MerR family transcriptional regulator [Paenibacillus phocaensis]|uniref:hypothetical protein n=1 Tax=Paenibacillus phocaensis TaxID=1776378 RepID=UPI0018E201CC|nr:hypothetical protein [Paenibacillus phocaensis]